MKSILTDKLLLGQYYAADSPVHRLDARSKIIASLLFMTTVLIAASRPAYLFLGGIFLIAVLMSRVPLRTLWRGLKAILFLAILTMVLHFFLTPGDYIWQWGTALHISREGIMTGLTLAFRFILLVCFASLLTLTTTPIDLTEGMDRLLTPLKRLGVPTNEFTMMMSIALRFIPTILEELERIMAAQRARGADFASGGLIKRAKAMVPLLVPLFVAAFRRSDELAQAMEAKCYQVGKNRSRWRVSQWRARDSFCLGLFLAVMATTIIWRLII
ncbi:MAG: energy-coupling factor transporter transmembrane protein EcfT [Clostridiales bacterium]|nr:energy-coupling factor transporter transmembrane protein EcfT [Clostridiales bacterium]